MDPLRRTLPVFALVLLVTCSPRAAWAGKPLCERCGCDKQLKRVCRLVVVCEEAEMPTYASTKQKVFQPHKGKVCKTQFRCDSVCTFHKDCACPPGCDSKQKGGCLLHCHCHSECGCKTMYGAKSTGCHAAACVKKPTGVTAAKVPVVKWVTTYVCCDGCDGKHRSP